MAAGAAGGVLKRGGGAIIGWFPVVALWRQVGLFWRMTKGLRARPKLIAFAELARRQRFTIRRCCPASLCRIWELQRRRNRQSSRVEMVMEPGIEWRAALVRFQSAKRVLSNLVAGCT